jgi:hypothetical protein
MDKRNLQLVETNQQSLIALQAAIY